MRINPMIGLLLVATGGIMTVCEYSCTPSQQAAVANTAAEVNATVEPCTPQLQSLAIATTNSERAIRAALLSTCIATRALQNATALTCPIPNDAGTKD